MAGPTELTAEEVAMRDGDLGQATRFAMQLVLTVAQVSQAPRLQRISAAHVDSCLYHGQSSLDFVRALVDGGGAVAVPTSLNVGGLDLAHPEAFLGLQSRADASREVMDAYVALGASPTFTCAPYQLPSRPKFGEHVAWAESNAIVFANSVLGARTSRYGDLMDICAAITGRVPASGLHVHENRAARRVFEIEPGLADSMDAELFAALLGHHVGRATGSQIPAVVGLDDRHITEEWMKAFGAASASSGGVALFHIVGVTPEAPDLISALQGRHPEATSTVTKADLRTARGQLNSATSADQLGAVSLGTPHMSQSQLVRVADLLGGRPVAVPTYISTGRFVLRAEPEAVAALEASGVVLVQDTCTYVSKIMDPQGAVMTNSAKWAYYAPGNLGFRAVLASTEECVRSALVGTMQLHRIDDQ